MAGGSSGPAADESLRELVDVFEPKIIQHLTEPSRLFQYFDFGLINMDQNKTIFEKEKHSREEAVRIMLNYLKNSTVPWFRKFKEALLEAGFETLYKILNMEDIDVEKYDCLFRLHYCHFTSDVDAQEVTRQLLVSGILKREDMEQIDAEYTLYGNSRAMKKLIFMLRDRNDKWFLHLVAATKECGYLLDDINPRLKEAETLRTMESVINQEVVNSEKQLAEREATREIKIRADESRRKEMQSRGSIKMKTELQHRSRENERLKVDLKDDEFDFRSFCPNAAAAADNDADDWRKIKFESNTSSQMRNSQTPASVRQHPSTSVNDQHGAQATKTKTAPDTGPDMTLQASTMKTTSHFSGSSACSSMSPDSPVYELKCLNCHADSTRSSDLRLVKDHCITVDEDFSKKADFEDYVVPKKLQGWRKDKSIKCKKCNGDWGVRAFYNGHSYNVLIATNFEMLGPDASCFFVRNWNEVPFKIHKLRQRRKPYSLEAAVEKALNLNEK